MVEVRDGVLHVRAALTMRSAADILEQGRRALDEGARVVDLGAVDEADSAALAVLFAWQRAAGGELRVRGLPAGLESLAALYGVDALLQREP